VDVATLKRALEGSAAEAPAEIDRAKLIVEEELRRYVVRRRSDRLAPLIRALRARGDAIIAAELERFGPRLASLTPDERDAVEGVMRGIVSKLLHDPIVQLKERSGSGADDAYARTVAELFDVDPDRE
jgi:glutamyl-tRNA reductase